jgi:hypothetical protein
LEFGSWSLEVGVWKLEFGSWSLEVGVWKLEFGSWSLEVGVWNSELIKLKSPDMVRTFFISNSEF